MTKSTSGEYGQFETSPDAIEPELRTALCERRHTDRLKTNYSIDGIDRCVFEFTCYDPFSNCRYDYRGFMMDVCRNFFAKKDMLVVLDMMAMYKLNVLHLHLTDDQGWRLEIPGLPELTKVCSI